MLSSYTSDISLAGKVRVHLTGEGRRLLNKQSSAASAKNTIRTPCVVPEAGRSGKTYTLPVCSLFSLFGNKTLEDPPVFEEDMVWFLLPEPTPFKFNGVVRVRLTDWGCQQYAKHVRHIAEEFGILFLADIVTQEWMDADAAGWRTLQLWMLMCLFSEHMPQGNASPFVDNMFRIVHRA